jgi:signal transduction histidine kinase
VLSGLVLCYLQKFVELERTTQTSINNIETDRTTQTSINNIELYRITQTSINNIETDRTTQTSINYIETDRTTQTWVDKSQCPPYEKSLIVKCYLQKFMLFDLFLCCL